MFNPVRALLLIKMESRRRVVVVDVFGYFLLNYNLYRWPRCTTGGVPRGTDIRGDAEHPAVRVSGRPRARQRSAGGDRGRCGTLAPSGRGRGARTSRPCAQDPRQATRRPHASPPVTSNPRFSDLQPLCLNHPVPTPRPPQFASDVLSFSSLPSYCLSERM